MTGEKAYKDVLSAPSGGTSELQSIVLPVTTVNQRTQLPELTKDRTTTGGW